MQMQIAVLEDDVSQLELLTKWLEAAGHRVRAFVLGSDLIATLGHETFDAMLLDWNVPDLTGIEVLKQSRTHGSVPVMVVSGRSKEEDVVFALRSGADAYLTKPVTRLELLARIDAMARRSGRLGQGDVIKVDPFEIDRDSRALRRAGEDIRLTDKDFELAALLLQNIGRLLSRRYICEAVWRHGVTESRTIDTHISRVRKKLKLTPEYGWEVCAVYRSGYRLSQVKRPVLPRPGQIEGSKAEAIVASVAR
jgi:two-component system, OmpR family, response regulator RegX3